MTEEKQYLFDTNAYELFLAGEENIVRRVRESPRRVRLSSVAAEEILVGRLSYLNRARNPRNSLSLTQAHEDFASLLTELGSFSLMAYSPEAEAIYNTFPSSILRIGPQDCRIAAQAMAHGLVVVTRDLRHFEAIGADCEDWSAA